MGNKYAELASNLNKPQKGSFPRTVFLCSQGSLGFRDLWREVSQDQRKLGTSSRSEVESSSTHSFTSHCIIIQQNLCTFPSFVLSKILSLLGEEKEVGQEGKGRDKKIPHCLTCIAGSQSVPNLLIPGLQNRKCCQHTASGHVVALRQSSDETKWQTLEEGIPLLSSD